MVRREEKVIYVKEPGKIIEKVDQNLQCIFSYF